MDPRYLDKDRGVWWGKMPAWILLAPWQPFLGGLMGKPCQRSWHKMGRSQLWLEVLSFGTWAFRVLSWIWYFIGKSFIQFSTGFPWGLWLIASVLAIYNPGGCMDEYHGSGFHCVCNEERCGGQVATLENGTEIGTRWYRSTGKRNGNVRLKFCAS